MKRKLSSFILVFVVGSIVGILGTITLPFTVHVSVFWPAAAIQSLSGILFGPYGALAGGLFPCLTNAISGAPLINIVGLIPANSAQSFLPMLICNKMKLKKHLPTWKDAFIFIVGGAIIPHFVGALIGSLTLFAYGSIETMRGFWVALLTWSVGNIPCPILFGLLFLKTLAPLLDDIKLFEREFIYDNKL